MNLLVSARRFGNGPRLRVIGVITAPIIGSFVVSPTTTSRYVNRAPRADLDELVTYDEALTPDRQQPCTS